MPVEIDISSDRLTVVLSGWSGFLATKRRLEVPYSNVVDARTEAISQARSEKSLLKNRGTDFIRLMTAGSFGRGDSKQFWYVKRIRGNDPVLVIDLKDFGFSRIVLEIPDPQSLAELIKAAATNR